MEYQFGDHRHRPVDAHYTGEGWVSNGIAFSDYDRMSTHTHKQSGERRLPTPQWAVNDTMLKEVLVRYMEIRAGWAVHPGDGTPTERLAAAEAAIKSKVSDLIATVGHLSGQYVAAKKLVPPPLRRLRALEIQLQSLDTRICMAEKGTTATLLGVVYQYYRVGLDSVGVGMELGIRPPHVRQILARLHVAAERLEAEKNNGNVAVLALRATPSSKPTGFVDRFGSQHNCSPQHNRRAAAKPKGTFSFAFTFPTLPPGSYKVVSLLTHHVHYRTQQWGCR